MSNTAEGASNAAGMNVHVERLSTANVIRVSGEVDLATAPQLRDAMSEFDADSGALIVDLTDVSFLDSSGLNVLVQCRKRLIRPDGTSTLRLVVTRSAIQRVLDITGLSQIFEIYGALDEAVQGS